mmetsp:Transcript_120617/g.323847  ORF Transcript_120617/g.323847 Transcript_120617/m.323847 type:complete len:83 (-) Transcript_120617:25-273(-)
MLVTVVPLVAQVLLQLVLLADVLFGVALLVPMKLVLLLSLVPVTDVLVTVVGTTVVEDWVVLCLPLVVFENGSRAVREASHA